MEKIVNVLRAPGHRQKSTDLGQLYAKGLCLFVINVHFVAGIVRQTVGTHTRQHGAFGRQLQQLTLRCHERFMPDGTPIL